MVRPRHASLAAFSTDLCSERHVAASVAIKFSFNKTSELKHSDETSSKSAALSFCPIRCPSTSRLWSTMAHARETTLPDNRVVLNWKPIPKGQGLENQGNTCYVNSVLQCLYHTKPWAHLFCDGDRNRHRKHCQKFDFENKKRLEWCPLCIFEFECCRTLYPPDDQYACRPPNGTLKHLQKVPHPRSRGDARTPTPTTVVQPTRWARTLRTASRRTQQSFSCYYWMRFKY